MPPFLAAFWRLLVASAEAATEGFRVVRREPRALVAWTVLWAAVLLVAGAVVAFGPKVVVGQSAQSRDLWGFFKHYGPKAVIILPLWVGAWTVITTAICRAVLEPDQRAIFHLKIGIAEARLALINAVVTIVTPFIVGVIGGAAVLIARPFLEAAPTMSSEIGLVGLATTIALLGWLYVRLSLVPIETFAEGRIHLTAYWPLTRGRFWYLFWGYLMVAAMAFAIIFLLSIVLFGLLAFLPQDLQPAADGDYGLRAGLLALAAVEAFGLALIWVTLNVLICAFQAYAYRVVAGPGPEHMAGLKEA